VLTTSAVAGLSIQGMKGTEGIAGDEEKEIRLAQQPRRAGALNTKA
jgi:hypothetical protein